MLDASAPYNEPKTESTCTSRAQATLLQLQRLWDEIYAFDSEILTRPSVIVLNKIDRVIDGADELMTQFEKRESQQWANVPVLMTSALKNEGVSSLKTILNNICHDIPAQVESESRLWQGGRV